MKTALLRKLTLFLLRTLLFCEFFSESQKITFAQLFSLAMNFSNYGKIQHAITDFQRIEPLPKIDHE